MKPTESPFARVMRGIKRHAKEKELLEARVRELEADNTALRERAEKAEAELARLKANAPQDPTELLTYLSTASLNKLRDSEEFYRLAVDLHTTQTAAVFIDENAVRIAGAEYPLTPTPEALAGLRRVKAEHDAKEASK